MLHISQESRGCLYSPELAVGFAHERSCGCR
uniref:Uncharacterized protein n=1 Tax=Anguilla anguilla TaxID=7936 RepID=A0A0E9TAX7_ANGAN